MNTIDKQINELKEILEKQNWRAIEVDTTGAIAIQLVLHKPKYRYLKTIQCIKLYDKLTDKKIIIDIVTANEIKINENINLYSITFDNGQAIKLKMY